MNDAEASAPSERELETVLRGVVMKLARRLRSERSDETLALAPLLALGTIDQHGPISPGALAALEGAHPSTLTRIIVTLQRRGLVRRVPHPSDGRASLIEITEVGRRIVNEERRRRQEWLAKMLASLSDDELAQLRATLPILASIANGVTRHTTGCEIDD